MRGFLFYKRFKVGENAATFKHRFHRLSQINLWKSVKSVFF